MTTTESTGPDGRRPNGRFAVGNKLARGNAVARRQQELRRLLDDALGTEQVRAVVESLVRLAVGGDVPAAGLLLSYAVGKPRQQPQVLDIDLPRLEDAQAVAEALRAVVGAVAGGELDLEAAQAVAGLVTTTATAVQWADLAARVELLESKSR